MGDRLSILAGDGQLVPEVLRAAAQTGRKTQLLCLTGRNDLREWNPAFVSVSNPLDVLFKLRAFRPAQICMVGGLSLSDRQREGILGFLRGRKSSRHRSRGDTSMSRLIGALELATGAKVIGVHELVDDLAAPSGHIAGPELSRNDRQNILFAMHSAREVGRLDIGQAVVCAGHRIVAVEDIGGTDELLQRVGRFVEQGMTGDGTDRLVLAKARKPGQPASTDLPAIGPLTVSGAARAGVAIICVQAENSLLIERAEIERQAHRLGISVFGAGGDE